MVSLSTDFESLRASFPSLLDRSCFATHSFGPCPAAMFADLEDYCASLRRRPTQLDEWMSRLVEMYGLVGRLLHAPSSTIALAASSTACHATILAALHPVGARRRLLTCAGQFPSIGYLAAAQEQRGFDVEKIDHTQLLDRIDERTAAVLIPLVTPFDGSLIAIADVLAACQQVGALPLVDATAALGIVPFDASALPPCVVVGGTVKWLCGGGTGLAFMSVHPAWIERLPPAYPGWLGHADFGSFSPDYVPAIGAARYQQGTPAIEPVYTARAGLRFVLDHGVEALRDRNRVLLDRLAQRAVQAGLQLRSPSESNQRAGLVAIEVHDAQHVVQALRTRKFDIDARGADAVRLGPHWCVSFKDCDRAIDLVADAVTR
jgi:kynureninase